VITPYDWQEGIGHRAQYVEAKLAHGAPVIAVSTPEGILLVTYRRQSRKLFEVYDRLAFAALGQQSDVEAIRLGAVDFASREGYQRSEADVTIQRVVSAMSQPIKQAFSDFARAPFVARSIFAEVGATPEADLYYRVDYTGDYALHRGSLAIAGTDEATASIEAALKEFDLTKPAESLVEPLLELWKGALGDQDDHNPAEGLSAEALLVERSEGREDRFRWLTSAE
jgi:proteasome alpha subunit